MTSTIPLFCRGDEHLPWDNQLESPRYLCCFSHAIYAEAEAVAEEAKAGEAERLKRDGPGEGDLGEMLAGTVDVTVLDAPRTLYRPRTKLPWGPVPTTGLAVAGTGKNRG